MPYLRISEIHQYDDFYEIRNVLIGKTGTLRSENHAVSNWFSGEFTLDRPIIHPRTGVTIQRFIIRAFRFKIPLER